MPATSSDIIAKLANCIVIIVSQPYQAIRCQQFGPCVDLSLTKRGATGADFATGDSFRRQSKKIKNFQLRTFTHCVIPAAAAANQIFETDCEYV